MTRMFFDARVTGRQMLSPGMIRLTFGGEALEGFPSTGIPDEYLRLFFPNPQTGRVHLPLITAEGRWTYPDGGQDAIRCSTYTVRNHRRESGEIDIDFVVHEGGVASDWAQNAQPGEVITINRPRGLYTPPGDILWQVLVADATGLPAISRILEQTPTHIQSRVVIEVAEPQHELTLPHHEHASITWLHGSGNGVAASHIVEVVTNMPLPPTPGYIWVAGEQKVVRAVRKHVRQVLELPAERYELVSYWTHEGEAWERSWKSLPAELRAAIDASWSSGRDAEEVRDEYEATLEKYGL